MAPDLAELANCPGPFASVCLVTEGGIDNAAMRAEMRWKTLRGELDDAGAPEPVLAKIDEQVATAHLSGEGLGVVVATEAEPRVEHMAKAPVDDRASWGAVPSLVPILASRQSSPTCLVVLADRSGADLSVSCHDRPEVHRQAGDADHPMAKSAPGGWSQPRYQRRAENTWEHNADDVAAEVVTLVERFDPRVVVLAGDVRAVQLLQQALPSPVAERIAVIEGGRAEDGSRERITVAVEDVVRDAVDADTAQLLGKFDEELGQSDRAADGPEDTLAALARSQVEVLLVEDRRHDSRLSFVGEDATQVGLAAADVEAMGATDPRQAPLVDVAVWAALKTGAGMRIVPAESGMSGGLGAILRWPS